MRIGEVAGMVGVNVQTLRYYEQLGLLEEPSRRISGYREYTTETVAEVRFIKGAQELGFSLKEIDEFIRLRRMGGNVCQTAYSTAQAKIQVIQEKIQSLNALKASLESLMASCVPSPLTGECSTIEELLPTSEPCSESPDECRPAKRRRQN